MKIKVCHITTVHPTFDNRIYHKECKSLLADGYEVHLIVANGKTELVDGIFIHGVKVNYTNRLSRFIKAPFAVVNAALLIQADVYHFHDPEILLACNKLLRYGKKVIYDVHEDLPKQILNKYYIPAFLRYFLSVLVGAYEKMKAKKLSGIITTVPTITNRFLKYNPRVTEVCNYPSLQQMEMPVDWKLKTDSICYIGGLTQVRGVVELINAMENSNLQLHLAGQFSPADLETQCKQLKGWQQVIYHGFVDRNDIQKILGISKIGMVTLYPIPNYDEAYPVKMFEYMSAGIPVICSNIPLWEKIVTENKCGISVDPKDKSAIAKAVSDLLSNESLMKEMGKNGRQAIEQKFNWNNEEEKLTGLYKQILAS